MFYCEFFEILFYTKTKILADFQISISVPLKLTQRKKREGIIALKNTIVSISKSSMPYEQKFSDTCVLCFKTSQKTIGGIYGSAFVRISNKELAKIMNEKNIY